MRQFESVKLTVNLHPKIDIERCVLTVFDQQIRKLFVDNTQSVINTDYILKIYANISKGWFCVHCYLYNALIYAHGK